MSIASEITRLKEAGEGPTLRLVTYKWSALALAVFGVEFGQHAQQVAADRLHSRVDAHLQELGTLGHDLPPGASGQGLCRSWMREGWLRRLPGDDGDEMYELTSSALAAQRIFDELARDRALLSESRLTTIVEAVARTAHEAVPDRDARITALDDEIARLTAERQRLIDGGEVMAASDEQILSGYLNVRNLLTQLPGDFRRVEEDIDRIHRRMIADFRDEERPKGEVLDDYLTASKELISATEQGRAFEGALAILHDEDLLAQFRANLRAILAHPFARSLSQRERQDFLAAPATLRAGLRSVQERQHKASRALADHLANLDSTTGREVEKVLRRLDQELAAWMRDARPRDQVPMDWMPGRLDVDHLRTRFHDPASELPPAALERISDAPAPPSLDAVRRYGGPLLQEVRAALVDALADPEITTVGDAFNTLPAGLRRPVEVLGLLQVLTRLGLWDGQDVGIATVQAIRPDGTVRELMLPRLHVTAADLRPRKENQ